VLRAQRRNVEGAHRIFVSYSHVDAALIDPIVQLLKVGNRVFSDHEIEPGQRWRETIEGAITDSSSVVVLWCCHSASSTEVQSEITFALESAKPLVPILLCSTPVDAALAEFQWINVSRVLKHMCEHVDVGFPAASGHVPRAVTDSQFLSVLLSRARVKSSAPVNVARRLKLTVAATIAGGILSVGACVAIAQFIFQSWPITVSAVIGLLIVVLLLMGSVAKSRAGGVRLPEGTDSEDWVLASTIRRAVELSERGELQGVLDQARQRFVQGWHSRA
jgi:TIR domain